MTEVTAAPRWTGMTSAQARRFDEVLRTLAGVLEPGPSLVVVDGHQHTAMFADRLADTLNALGQECARLIDDHPGAVGPRPIAVADGPGWRERPPGSGWDVVIWLRTPPPADAPHASQAEHDAHIVVDLHDTGWPVIRHIE